MVTFFDTETTGIVQKDFNLDDVRQPRVVSVAALAFDGGRLVHSVVAIIKPSGFVIPDDAAAHHGITTEYAMKNGLDAQFVIPIVDSLLMASSSVGIFNAPFDVKMWDIEHLNAPWASPFKTVPYFCCMRPACSAMKMPSQYGDYKWPTLAEAYQFYTGKTLQEAHQAFTDTWHLAELAFRMREVGHIQF